MARRTTPQSKTDDLAFPVRVKFAVPGGGLRSIDDTLDVRLREWLARELGRGAYACHAAPSLGTFASAVYFRRVADALRFVEAFPEWELADGTMSGVYTAPGR